MDKLSQRNLHWIIFGLLIFLKDIQSHPRYHQENYIEDDKYLPNFLTVGQTFSIAVGSTVVLPCKLNETENSGKYVLAWKRNIAVLTAGTVKVTVNPRLRLLSSPTSTSNEYDSQTDLLSKNNNYNLEIRDVRLSDAGEYVCQIGSMIPKEIYHTLQVLIPPKITKMSPSNRVDVVKGAHVRLECEAEGNPPPKIVWTRKNNVMLNGDPNMISNIFEVQYADRHTIGHYRCTADNTVGLPDTREFEVNVNYPPEIEIEQTFVHTGVGVETKLTCIVHAEPKANIIWYKDTTQLGTTEQHSQQNRGSRYNLIIRNVSISDLGNYTCQASNSLGKARLSMILSAIPTICVFDSPTISNYRELYNISWSVQSYSPIREYRLFYRKELTPRNYNNNNNNRNDRHDDNNQITSYSYNTNNGGVGLRNWANTGSSSSGGGKSAIYGSQYYNNGGGGGGGGYYNSNGFHPEQEKWRNIILPENINNMGGGLKAYHNHDQQHNNEPNVVINMNKIIRHKSSYLFRNLQAGTNYETKIQARNDYGWNKLSPVFHFTTRAQQFEVEPSAQPAVSKTAGILDKDFTNTSPKLSTSFSDVQIQIFNIIFIIIYFKLFS